MIKEQKGITLIALVITIIVLLILAGVSIAMLTGQNGILTKATGANEKSSVAEVDEAIRLGLAEILANHMDPTFTDTETDDNGVTGQITEENLKNAIEVNNTNITDTVIETVAATAEDTPEGASVGDIVVTYTYSEGKTHQWIVSTADDSLGSIKSSPTILKSSASE